MPVREGKRSEAGNRRNDHRNSRSICDFKSPNQRDAAESVNRTGFLGGLIP